METVAIVTSQSSQLATALPTTNVAIAGNTSCRCRGSTSLSIVIGHQTHQTEVELTRHWLTPTTFLYRVSPRRPSTPRTFCQRFTVVQFPCLLHTNHTKHYRPRVSWSSWYWCLRSDVKGNEVQYKYSIYEVSSIWSLVSLKISAPITPHEIYFPYFTIVPSPGHGGMVLKRMYGEGTG